MGAARIGKQKAQVGGHFANAKAMTMPQSASQKTKKVIIPQAVVNAGLGEAVSAKELYDRISRQLSGLDSRARDVAVEAVRKAVDLIRDGGNLTELEKARGFKFPKNYQIAVALALAESDINYVDEAIDFDGSSNGKGKAKKAAKLKKSESRSFVQAAELADLRNALKRVETIIASLLQELVARDKVGQDGKSLGAPIVSLHQVRALFGKDQPFCASVASKYIGNDVGAAGEVENFSRNLTALIEEMSSITRLPNRKHEPDAGQLSLEEIEENRRQSQKLRRLFLYSKRRGRVILVKTIEARQQLRCVNEIRPLDDNVSDEALQAIRENIVRNVEENYLPLARGLNLDVGSDEVFTSCSIKVKKNTGAEWVKKNKIGAIQYEMEHRVLDFMDPEAGRKIRKMCDYMASSARMQEVYKTIVQTLKKAGYELGVDYKIEYRKKAYYSIFSKLLFKERQAARKDLKREKIAPREKKVACSKLGDNIDFSEINDFLGFKVIANDCYTVDPKTGDTHTNDRANYAVVKAIREAFNLAFGIWEKRDKDYFEKINRATGKKLNKATYKAWNITCVDKGQPKCQKDITENRRPRFDEQLVFPQRFEIEITTPSWEEFNALTHDQYKERPIEEELKDENGDLTSPTWLLNDLEKCLYEDAKAQLNARFGKTPLPEHFEPTHMIVGDRDGVLAEVPRGIRLGELIKHVIVNDGVVVDNDGKALVKNAQSYERFVNRIAAMHFPDAKEGPENVPVDNAFWCKNLLFPRDLPEMAMVYRVHESKPKKTSGNHMRYG